MQNEVIKCFHELAHAGIKATQKLVKENYLWNEMSKQITNFVRSCSDCQKSKIHRKEKAPLQAFLQPASRFTDIHVDITGPFPQCRGQQYLFTVIDCFTRYPVAVPMASSTAEDCARALLDGWIQHFGVPTTIVSDRRRQFESNLWKELLKISGTIHQMTTSYHPQSNGMIERFHRQLKSALRAKLHSTDWLSQLPIIMLGIRSAVKEDIGCSAAQMVFGSSPRLPGNFYKTETQMASEPFLRQLQQTISDCSFVNPKWHGNSKQQHLKGLDRCHFVHVQCPPIHATLEKHYEGPFKVVARSAKHFDIDRNGKVDKVSIDRLIPATNFMNASL
jgi:transposase InsO family protein